MDMDSEWNDSQPIYRQIPEIMVAGCWQLKLSTWGL